MPIYSGAPLIFAQTIRELSSTTDVNEVEVLAIAVAAEAALECCNQVTD